VHANDDTLTNKLFSQITNNSAWTSWTGIPKIPLLDKVTLSSNTGYH